jgi:protein SCO1/2
MHFLTGEQPEINRLMNAMGFRYQFDPVSKQFAHASGVLVATPSGRISRVLYGVEYAPRDLRLALVESAENRIGTPVDALMLYCFHYDPSTGKYSTIVMNILRICATLTILALSALVFVLIRKERRARIEPRTV